MNDISNIPLTAGARLACVCADVNVNATRGHKVAIGSVLPLILLSGKLNAQHLRFFQGDSIW